MTGQEREALAKGCREWEDRYTEAIPATREFAEFLGEWMWRAALAAREEPQEPDAGTYELLAHFRDERKRLSLALNKASEELFHAGRALDSTGSVQQGIMADQASRVAQKAVRDPEQEHEL